MPAKTRSIRRWNVAGALHSPNGMTFHSNRPFLVLYVLWGSAQLASSHRSGVLNHLAVNVLYLYRTLGHGEGIQHVLDARQWVCVFNGAVIQGSIVNTETILFTYHHYGQGPAAVAGCVVSVGQPSVCFSPAIWRGGCLTGMPGRFMMSCCTRLVRPRSVGPVENTLP